MPKYQGDVVHHKLLKLHYARNEAENDMRWIDFRNYWRNYVQDQRDKYAEKSSRSLERGRKAKQWFCRKKMKRDKSKINDSEKDTSGNEQLINRNHHY